MIPRFNRNVWLLLAGSMLTYLAAGIFAVDFNLYVLAVGIHTDELGRILSAAPFAQMLAAIPIGVFAERLGFRKAFLVIYTLAGLSLFGQAATSNATMIYAAAFLQGLALSGDFVVRLPFLAANTLGSQRTAVFSLDAILSGSAYALGALLAGFLPNLFQAASLDLPSAYRATLYCAGAILLLAALPVFLIRDTTHLAGRKISLRPYLWGIDRFTVQSAGIEFFIGLTFGLIVPFMNLIFLNHLGSSREFYASVEALAFVPTILLTLFGPYLARKLGIIQAITLGRLLMPLAILVLGLVSLPNLGAGSYWVYLALFRATQSIWFAFTMETAAPSAKTALSAWLGITFQLGMMISAPLTGLLLAQSDYLLPFMLSAGAALVTAGLTWAFMRSRIPEAASEASSG